MARGTLAGVAAVALLGCWLFSDSLFTGKVLAGDDLIRFTEPFHPADGERRPANPYMYDAAWVFHPDMLVARAQLRRVELPIWNPYQGAGQPLLASQQTAPLYPLNWLAVIFPFWHALAWIALLKVLAAGAGTLLFARLLRLDNASSLLAAVSFAFSTYLIDWFAHPHTNAYVLLPWLMLAAHRVATRGTWRAALLLACATGLSLLGGQPESTFLVFLPTAAWCLWRPASDAHDRAIGLGRRAVLLAAGTLLGIGVAGVVLVPFVEMLQHSEHVSRSGGPGSWTIAQSFVLPERWGRPDKFELAGGPSNYPERTGYFGTLPLLIGAAGLALRPRREQVFFFVAGLLALGLVVAVPVYSHFAAEAPGLSVINRFRALILCCFCGAMLAGFGLQNVISAVRDGRRRSVAAALACVTLPLAGWVALQAGFSAPLGAALGELPVLGRKPEPGAVVQLAVALRWWLLAALGAGLVAVAVMRPRLASGVAIGVVAVTAFDLVTMARGYIPAIEPAAAEPAPPPAVRYAQAHVGHDRVGGGAGLQPNLAERFGLRGARIHALPALERRTELWLQLGGRGMRQRLVTAPLSVQSLFSVKFIFSAPDDRGGPDTREVMPGLRENRLGLPRAWLAYRWTPAHGQTDALNRVRRLSELTKPVIGGAAPPPADGLRGAGHVHFLEDRDRSVVLDVEARRRGFLILGDTYYPGWRAEVDGRPARVHPANVAFRAVSVPAGRHVVRFDYRPASVRIGAALTILALLVIAGGLLVRELEPNPNRVTRV
jgi:hypothetical protein